MPTFPVDLATFLGNMRVEQQVFDLMEGRQVQNITAGGEVLSAGNMPRLWFGTINLAHRLQGPGRVLQAKLQVLRGSGASFYINDLTHDGVGFTAEINGVNTDGRLSLRAAGANRVLRAGDYIGFTYAGRRALHQAIEGANANAEGVTGAFEVVPPIRPGWAAGAAVTVGAPRCVAVLSPGKTRIGQSVGVRHESASFEWVQTLRQVV